jgi:hypothetical protein
MHREDSSSAGGNQFSIDASAFISETIPGTGIRLLRARPECEAELAKQLSIPLRLKLLRRQAPPRSNTPRLLQDDVEVGTTSTRETVCLILTVVVEPTHWHGGWCIAIVPLNEAEAWRAYLAGARAQFVLEARRRA